MRLKIAQPLIVGLVLLTFYSTSYAERICVHGHSGAVEDPKAKFTKYGGGLSIYPKNVTYSDGIASGGGDWVHYSVPLDSNVLYDRVRIRATEGICPWIKTIHVYDGERLISSETYGGPNYLNLVTHYIEHDLEKPSRFWNSMGVSILTMTHDMCTERPLTIQSVCAFE